MRKKPGKERRVIKGTKEQGNIGGVYPGPEEILGYKVDVEGEEN